MTAIDGVETRVLDVRRGDGRFGNPPVRSFAQQMDALRKGNEVRVARAALKRDVKHGRQDVLDVLAEPPEFLATAKVLELLLAVPKIGRVKAEKILRRESVSPSKTVGGLSTRQRTALIAALGPQR